MKSQILESTKIPSLVDVNSHISHVFAKSTTSLTLPSDHSVLVCQTFVGGSGGYFSQGGGHTSLRGQGRLSLP